MELAGPELSYQHLRWQPSQHLLQQMNNPSRLVNSRIIEVSILRFTIRILRFDTIQMDKDTNLYFVSLERRILRIVSVSFCISIRYVSQRYNNFKIRIFFRLYLFYSTSHILLGDQKTIVWGKKRQKETKTTNKMKNILAIEREESKTPITRQCKWVTLIYFIYFILSCRDIYIKAQGGSVDPLDFKK
jgi:hypothetical protein